MPHHATSNKGLYCLHRQENKNYILTGKITLQLNFVRLDMWFTKRAAQAYHDSSLGKALGLFELINFYLSGMLDNLHEYFNSSH